MEFHIRIPRWKAYLYTLLQRYRLFKWLNAGWIKLDLNREEIVLLRNMFNKYLPKGVMRKVRTVRYERLIKEVLVRHVTIAGRQEIELAMKLTWVQHIKSEELIMEMKQIKEFGKEVGLKAMQMAKMDETALITAILKAVNPHSKYSREFVEWYNDMPDNYFDDAETIDATGGGNGNAASSDIEAMLAELNTNLDEMTDTIDSMTKIGELREFIADDDFSILFQSVDASQHKSAKALKDAMLNALQNPGANGDSANPADALEDLGIDEETITEMVAMINDIETDEQLLDFVSDETVEAVFDGKLDIGDSIDVESVKEQMLEILGVEPEQEEEKPMGLKERLAAKKAAANKSAIRPKSKPAATSDDDYVIPFDPNAFDPNEVYAGAEGLAIPKLRKFAKQLKITAGPGSNKETILELIANRLMEMAEGAGEVTESIDTDEVTVTKSMVNDAVGADDKETLIAMCEQLGITLNALQKKSSKLMGTKLIEVVPDDAPATRNAKPAGKTTLANRMKNKDTSAAVAETKSMYQLVEEMVLAGETEKAITDAIKPILTEKGKTLLYIKKRVKQLIEIITEDNA